MSFEAFCAEVSHGGPPDALIASRSLRDEMEERLDRLGADGKYDNIVATAESADVITFLDPVSLDELYGAQGTVPPDNLEAPLMPGYRDEMSFADDSGGWDSEPAADRRLLASLADAGIVPGAASETLAGDYEGDAGYHGYVSDTVPSQPPQFSLSSAFGSLFDTGSDSGADSAADDLFYAGDSPLSTHTLFESVSISGTYPDSDVLEIELPALSHPGGSQMTIGAGWLLPSGILIPLGAETDHTMDESAYYLSLILRF